MTNPLLRFVTVWFFIRTLIPVVGMLAPCMAVAQAPPQNQAIPISLTAKQVEELTEKARAWVVALDLRDSAKSERVQALIAEHLQAVQLWHDTHPASLVPEGINPVTGRKLSELDRKLIADSSIPSEIHSRLMAGLRKELEEKQVEKILDEYTIGKVAFTMKAYRAIVSDLTAEEDQTILGFLKEAREMAIDYKSMKEISAIFEIYKTKAEQHLIANGRNWRALYSAYVESLKAAKQPSSGTKKP